MFHIFQTSALPGDLSSFHSFHSAQPLASALRRSLDCMYKRTDHVFFSANFIHIPAAYSSSTNNLPAASHLKRSKMFIKPLLLLALSFKALSLPTTDEALEERDYGAWIDSFEDADTTCSNSSSFVDAKFGPRASLSDGVCVPYHCDSRMGGSWGDIATIETFSDLACTVHEEFIPNDGTGPGFCTLFDCERGGDVGNACFCNSVMGHSIPPIGQ